MPKAARHIITMSEDGPIWGARALPVTRGDDRAVEERDAPAFLRGDRGSPTTRDAEAKLAVAKARLDAAREQREQRSAYEHQSYEQQRSAPRRAEPREIDLQRTSGGFTALRGALGDGAAAAAKPPPDDTPPDPPTPAASPRPPDPPTPAASPRPPDPPTPAATPKPATKDESKEKLRQLRQYTRDLLKEKEALEQRLSSAEQVALERRLSSAAAERPPPGDDRDSALASTELYGECRRASERASAAEDEARRSARMLEVARASKSVDVAARRRSSARILAAALLGRRGASAAAAPAASAEAAVGRAKDRERLLADLETAAAEVSAAAAMRTALEDGRFALRFSNARGDARRFAAALEACLEHGARGCYGDYLAGAASAASIAADTGRHVEIARALERVHVACSRGTVAKPLVRPWHARCRWGVGRLRLFELFNHGAALPALAALAAYDDARDDGGDDDAAPGRVSVAGAIGARHTHDRGAVVRDAAGRRRLLAALGGACGATFDLRHVAVATADLEDGDPGDAMGPATLAHLRHAGFRSPASLLLERAPWAPARVVGGVFQASADLTDSFSEDHVVCWQWQTRSQRLSCVLRGGANADDEAFGGDARRDDPPWASLFGGADDDDDAFSDDGRHHAAARVQSAVVHADVVLGADATHGFVREASAVHHRANESAVVEWRDVYFRRGQRDRRIRYRIAACRARAFADLERQSLESLEDAAWVVAGGAASPPAEAVQCARLQLTGHDVDRDAHDSCNGPLKSLASWFKM